MEGRAFRLYIQWSVLQLPDRSIPVPPLNFMLAILRRVRLPARRSWFRREHAERGVNVAAIAIGLGCLAASLAVHIKVLAYPGPQELNEPAAWYATRLLMTGRNPYLPGELPGSAQFFGPFYNYVVIALEPLFGTGYFGHRLINFFCIGGVLWVIGTHMRRLGANLGIVLTSLSVLYWLILDNIMITARPDALGWWLFLLGLLIPASRNYSVWASVAGLSCAVLAFQCKAYFALAGVATLLGIASLRSARMALWSGVAYFSALAISVAITSWFFPMYFLQAFLMQRSMVAGNSSDAMSRIHTVLFLERGWPFLILLSAGLGRWLSGPGRERWRRWRTGGSVEASLLPQSGTEVLGWTLVAHLVMVYFYMGRNGGAWFTYHTHLLFPLLLLMTAAAMRAPVRKMVATILLAVFAVTSLQVRWAPTDSTPYQRLCDLIREERGEVFALAAAAEPLELNFRRVYDDGFTLFVGYALGDRRPETMLTAKMLADRCAAQRAEIEEKVRTRTFSLILTEEQVSHLCSIELIKEHYRVVEAFHMPIYFGHGPVWVWRPLPPRGESDDGDGQGGT